MPSVALLVAQYALDSSHLSTKVVVAGSCSSAVLLSAPVKASFSRYLGGN